MEEFNMNDFFNVICLKNQLLLVPIDALMEKYEDYENFIVFLDSFYVLLSIDSSFLLFDDNCISKVEKIIHENRFKYKDKEIVSVINGIIMYLNSLKIMDDNYKKMLKNSYLYYQEDCRKAEFVDEDFFLQALGFDAVVYYALEEDNMDLLEDSDILFLSSINYFIETIPWYFENEKVKQIVMNKLEEIGKKGWPFKKVNRKYSIETREYLQKIKKREE